MGNTATTTSPPLPYDRNIYATLVKYQEHKKTFTSFYVYTFSLGYRRFKWNIHKRFHEFKVLDKYLRKKYPNTMDSVSLPYSTTLFSSTSSTDGLTKRGTDLAAYIEFISQNELIFDDREVKVFLEIGGTSFLPELGRKGKAGYLRRCSGGYAAKFSGSEGFIKSWTGCWVAAHDTHIACYPSQSSLIPDVVLRIDSGFSLSFAGRYIIIRTNSRKFTLYAPTERITMEWIEALKEFYSVSPRALQTELSPTANPIRYHDHNIDVFSCSSDYFHSLSVALLSARVEICIAAYMLSPEILLTRPPLPPSRLDQILRYKVDQGVKLYVLLNKQSRFSSKLKQYFQKMGPNVQCLRHSNKTSDGTPLWHNERIIVVDRKVAFIGSIDLEVGRYDDRQHILEDEDGILFPGSDYRQYSPSLLRPVRSIIMPSEKNRRTTLGSQVVEAEVSAEATYVANVSVDPEGAQSMDTSTHSVVYPVEPLHSTITHDSNPHFGEGEDYGAPETEQEAMARLEAETYAQATPFQELDVVRQEHTGGFLGGLLGLFGQLGDMLEDVIGATTRGDTNRRPLRELFPRQPFHDLQVKISGVAAHDIASFFLQRWNFNRLTKGELDLDIFSETTDNPYFSQCGRCGLSNLQESTTACPGCQLSFGSISKFVAPTLDLSDPMNLVTLKLPDLPASFSYIVFECHYYQKVGCNLIGDGPTIVENVLETQSVFDPGMLLHSQGEYAPCLIERGLFASIGDVFLAIDGRGVGHLDYTEVIRLINRRFASIQDNPDARLSVIFRRHYIQAVTNTYRSASLTRQPDFASAMRSFDNPTIQSYVRYKDTQIPIDPVQTKVEQYPVAPPLTEAEEFKAPTEPYSYPGSSIQYLDASADNEQERVLSYPALPGVALAAPSEPLPYSFFSVPLEDVTLPRPTIADSSLPSTPNQEPSASLIVEVVEASMTGTPEELEVPETEVAPVTAQPIPPSSTTYLVPDEMQNMAVELPDAPIDVPMVFPDAPTHAINRGLEITPTVPLETSERTVAMSGRSPPPPSSSDRSVDYSASPLGVGGSSYPELPAVPAVIATTVDNSNRTPSRVASVSPDLRRVRISPLYTPESQFPPTNRRYACQEAESLERRLCHSILVHESAAFESSDISKCAGSCQVQVLRSGGLWSIGEEDKSIHDAYIHAIENSNHLIYIENQFLIGPTAPNEIGHNKVFDALLKRLIKACKNSENFRIIIVLPIHPIGDYVHHDTPRTLLFSQYLSISRGGVSLMELFVRECPNVDPFLYIGFFSLRTWGVMNEKVVTEQVYVHDKIMIVDDRIVIIGSANLTDRSLVGYQDSEIAVRIEDSSHQGITLGGRNWQVGIFPHQFRISLMKKHLGLPADFPSLDLTDMAFHSPHRSDPYHHLWIQTATHNTQLYDYLDGDCSYYRCQRLEQYKTALKSRILPSYLDEEIKHHVHQIRGYLVNWPNGFLGAENLTSMISKKYYPPVHLLYNEK